MVVPGAGTAFRLVSRMNAGILITIFKKYRQKYRQKEKYLRFALLYCDDVYRLPRTLQMFELRCLVSRIVGYSHRFRQSPYENALIFDVPPNLPPQKIATY